MTFPYQQRERIYDAMNAHTTKQLRVFHNKYGKSCLGYDASTKSSMIKAMIGDLEHQGYDAGVALSMARSDSSYE